MFHFFICFLHSFPQFQMTAVVFLFVTYHKLQQVCFSAFQWLWESCLLLLGEVRSSVLGVSKDWRFCRNVASELIELLSLPVAAEDKLLIQKPSYGGSDTEQ